MKPIYNLLLLSIFSLSLLAGCSDSGPPRYASEITDADIAAINVKYCEKAVACRYTQEPFTMNGKEAYCADLALDKDKLVAFNRAYGPCGVANRYCQSVCYQEAGCQTIYDLTNKVNGKLSDNEASANCLRNCLDINECQVELLPIPSFY